MAYISKEDVKKIRENLKSLYPRKQGYKISVTRRNSMEVVVALMEGPHEVGETYQQLNHYHPEHYSGFVYEFVDVVSEVIEGVKEYVDYNAGDVTADYGNSNYFQSIEIGKWDKPYVKVEV